MNALKAAVIGVGYFGSRHAARLSQLQGVELAYLVDSDPARVESLARKMSANTAKHYREVLGKVDIATIAVPTRLHAEIAEALLNSGAHVLVEKPLTVNLSEADRVVQAAVANGRVLCVGHLERFNPAMSAARSRISEPRFIESHRLSIFQPRGTDVDVILDLMIHDLDIILSLTDSPVIGVHANGLAVLTDGIDIANARIEFANGCVANVTASRVSAKQMRKLRIFQTDCYLGVDFRERALDVAQVTRDPTGGMDRSIEVERLSFPEGDELQAELQAFVDAVRGQQRQAATAQDGRRALELALQVSHQILNSKGK
jgi:predicted dehydrogenase